MSRSLTAADRRSLIRLASTLPAGSDERRAILAGLTASYYPVPSKGPTQDRRGNIYALYYENPAWDDAEEYPIALVWSDGGGSLSPWDRKHYVDANGEYGPWKSESAVKRFLVEGGWEYVGADKWQG